MKATSANRGLRVLLVSLVVLLVGFAVLLRSAYAASTPGEKLDLGTVQRLVEARQVKAATLLDEDAQMVGTRCLGPPPPLPGDGPAPALHCEAGEARFHAAYPRSDVSTQLLIQSLATSGAVVEVDKQPGKAMAKLVATFVLPLVILANLFGLIFLSRSADSSIADIAGFGRIGRRRKRQAGTGVSFADVAGAEEAVEELREVTTYLEDPKRFEAYGAAPPKGVLLFGSPGCGKTLLARAVAGESKVPFLSISGAEFVESLVGVGAARVRDLFAQVRAVAPAIVFIDEIDAVGRRRGGEGSSGGEREQTLNQLLVEMDGFEAATGIVVIGATNRPDMLDPALLRPGRFDRHITVEPPDMEGRHAILALHARNRPLSAEVDLEALARRTPGFTGADLANVVNEAALLALRQGPETPIGAHHLSEAVLRVTHGPRRRGRILSAEERARLAYHEAGHAIVAAGVGQRGQIARVSIVARGRGLGQTMVGDDERALHAASELEARLSVAMGGIAAEELYFGESSTTAQDDIERATAMATDMVGLYGMSPAVGRRRLVNHDDGFLGDGAALEAASGPVLAAFDAELKRLLDHAEDTASRLLVAHRQELEALAQALQDHETLEGPALEAYVAAVGPTTQLAGNGGSAASRPRVPT